MSEKFSVQLDESEYRRFLLKVLNDDVNLAHKTENLNDSIYLVFQDPQDNSINYAELNMQTREFTSSFNDKSLLYRYLSNDVNLGYSQTKFDYDIEQIFQKVNELEQLGLNRDNDSDFLRFNDVFSSSSLEFDNDSGSISNLNILVDMQEKIQEQIEKINELDSLFYDFEGDYLPQGLYVNDVLFDDIEVSNKLSEYSNNYRYLKEELESENVLLKYAIKNEVEKYLSNESLFRNIELDSDNAVSIAKTITQNQNVNKSYLFSMVAEGNLENPMERLKQHIEVYHHSAYIDRNLKSIDLYNFSVQSAYANGKLFNYLQSVQEHSFDKAVHITEGKMKELYGQKFDLLSDNEKGFSKDSIIRSIDKITKYETFNLKDLRNKMFFSDVFVEHDVKQFWDNKSFTLLHNYMESKGINIDVDSVNTSNISEYRNWLYDQQNNTPFTVKSLDRVNHKVEESISNFHTLKHSMLSDVKNSSLSDIERNSIVANYSFASENISSLQSFSEEIINAKDNLIKDYDSDMELE